MSIHTTYVHRAYKNPPKQNIAMSIRATNCESIARKDKIIILFFSVTNTRLYTIKLDPLVATPLIDCLTEGRVKPRSVLENRCRDHEIAGLSKVNIAPKAPK